MSSMDTAQQGFPLTVPGDLVERLLSRSSAFRQSPLTADERELVALHLDGMAARVRAGEVLEVDVDTDWDGDSHTEAKTVRVVIPE